MSKKTNPKGLYINGNLVRQTHSATIASVLGDHSEVPSVESKGSSFYNSDSWTLRVFCAEMCKWSSQNPNCIPTVNQIRTWIQTANHQVGRVDKKIVIANTQDELDRSMLRALVGGGYHEAWHSRYSKRDNLDPKIVVPNVLKRWSLVQNWAPFHSELQKWNNVIEDIRIERIGIKEFGPTRNAMVELQDFVLNLEVKGLANARSHGHTGERNALSVITGTFRDLGLGYTESSLQREVILSYEKDNKDGYDIVNEGSLRPLLDKSIDLTDSAEDKYECLWIAMDVIIALVEAGDTGEDGEGGDGGDCEPQETKCPKCGAEKKNLKIRKGNDGKHYLVCSQCGHQEEVEISEGGGQGGEGEGESFEMEDPEDNEGEQGEGGEQGDTEGEGSDKEGDTEGEGDSDKEGEDSDGDGKGEGKDKDPKPPVFKVGDIALFNGVEVKVVKASKPNAQGIQNLEVDPV